MNRRRSLSEVVALVDRIKQHLAQIDGSENDIVFWIQIQNDASRIDMEAEARRREHQERSH